MTPDPVDPEDQPIATDGDGVYVDQAQDSEVIP